MSNKKLSEKLKSWRAERPDEWIMDEFIRKAIELEAVSAQSALMQEMADNLQKLIVQLMALLKK